LQEGGEGFGFFFGSFPLKMKKVSGVRVKEVEK
jgi:hypothetical protein